MLATLSFAQTVKTMDDLLQLGLHKLCNFASSLDCRKRE